MLVIPRYNTRIYRLSYNIVIASIIWSIEPIVSSFEETPEKKKCTSHKICVLCQKQLKKLWWMLHILTIKVNHMKNYYVAYIDTQGWETWPLHQLVRDYSAFKQWTQREEGYLG